MTLDLLIESYYFNDKMSLERPGLIFEQSLVGKYHNKMSWVRQENRPARLLQAI